MELDRTVPCHGAYLVRHRESNGVLPCRPVRRKNAELHYTGSVCVHTAQELETGARLFCTGSRRTGRHDQIQSLEPQRGNGNACDVLEMQPLAFSLQLSAGSLAALSGYLSHAWSGDFSWRAESACTFPGHDAG